MQLRTKLRIPIHTLAVISISFTSFLLCHDINAASPLPSPMSVWPKGEPSVIRHDYFTEYHGNPCDFETDGDVERITVFGPGIKSKNVKNGVLGFSTGAKDNYFYFGRFAYPDDPENIPDENIGFGWPQWGQFLVRIRLKQSLPLSVLSTSFRGLHGAAGNVPGRITPTRLGDHRGKTMLNGTAWQEVEIPFVLDRGTPIRAFCFEFDGENNNIEIDYIRMELLSTPVFYRKSFIMPDDPVFAEIRVSIPGEHTIHVNGECAHSYHGYRNVDVNPVVDITPYLRKGRNVIALEAPNTRRSELYASSAEAPYSLVCRGVALAKNGEYVSFNSDNSWKGSFVESDGWRESGFDDLSWRGVSAKPLVGGDPQPCAYVGPLNVQPVPAISRLQDGMRFSAPVPAGCVVRYELVNSMTGARDQSGSFDARRQGGAIETHSLSYKPSHPGVWNLALRLMDDKGGEVDRRTIECAVVGPIEQKRVSGEAFTEGMNLRRIVEIDCTVEPPRRAGAAEQEMRNAPQPGEFDVTLADDSSDMLDELGLDAPAGKEKTPKKNAAATKAPGLLYDFAAPGHKSQAPRSAVVQGKAGKYRESTELACSGFGYLFSVENLHRPHLVEVEYPDDAERQMLVKVFSSNDADDLKSPAKWWDWHRQQRWHTSVVTGGVSFPASDGFRKLYLVFWPDGHKDINTIQFVNWRNGMRAAARTIRVYEIDDLPALDLPDTPNRLFGLYNERASHVTGKFYSGRYSNGFNSYDETAPEELGDVRDWYVTIENLIKYLRFAGHNLYVAGLFQYSGVYLPEIEGRGSQCLQRIPSDRFRLMAAMFEQNGLYLLAGCEYDNTWVAREKCWPTNWEVRHNRADTIFAVARDGRQSVTGISSTHVLDYQNPAVEEDIRAVIRLIVKAGKPYRSFRGICFNTRNISFPSLPEAYLGGDLNSSLAWGWQDNAVSEFLKQTGVKIPVSDEDPDRFAKRYDYVTHNPEVLQQWIDFRCRRVHSQVKRLLDDARAEGRPDIRFYVNQVFLPEHERNLFLNGTISYSEGMSRRGFDRGLYVEEGIVNLPEVPRDGLLDDAAWNVFFGLESRCYWTDARGFYRCRGGAAHSQEVLPVEPYAYWAYTLGMIDATPSTIVFSQSDRSFTTGAEQRFRPFIKFFRGLPDGSYVSIAGPDIAPCPVLRRSTADKRIFYVSNPTRWNVRTDIEFDRDSIVIDRVSIQEAAESREMSLDLLPYENRMFECDPAEAEITKVSSKLSEEGLEEIAGWLSNCRNLVAGKGGDTERGAGVESRMRKAMQADDWFECDCLARALSGYPGATVGNNPEYAPASDE